MFQRLREGSEAVIAIDGSRFKAVNTRDKNYTHGAIRRRMEQVEASIARYLSALDTADRQEGEVAEVKSIRLKDKLARRSNRCSTFERWRSPFRPRRITRSR